MENNKLEIADLLEINDRNKIVTNATSLKVAEVYGKRHDNVLRDIRNIIKTCPDLEECFEESEYINSRGKTYPMFTMNRKGFILLVMGFTGEKAILFRKKFVDAFDAMEEQIKQLRSLTPSKALLQAAKAAYEQEQLDRSKNKNDHVMEIEWSEIIS